MLVERISDSDKNLRFNLNDFIFNFQALKDVSKVPLLKISDRNEFRDYTNKASALFGQEAKVSDPTGDQRARLKTELEELAKTKQIADGNFEAAKLALDLVNNDISVLEKKFMEIDSKAATIIKKEDLAHTLRLTSLKLKTLNEETISVELSLNKNSNSTRILYGCFEARTGKNKPCPDLHLDVETVQNSQCSILSDGKEPYYTPLDLNYDPTNGRLTLQASLCNPDENGLKFTKKTASDSDFQTIPTEKLLNRTLFIELYPRRFLEHLELLSGTAQIKGGNIILFQGNMSLSTDKSQEKPKTNGPTAS